jgi:iron complex transport system ATP-binding protein
MLFDDGRTIAGPVKEVLNCSNLEALYQCDMDELPATRGRHFVPKMAPSV